MSATPQTKENASLRAAKWLLAAQERHQRARGASSGPMPSIRSAAKLFGVEKTIVGRHVKALKDGLPSAYSTRGSGRPPTLNDDEEAELEAYARRIIESGSRASKALIHDEANRLRARRDPRLPAVGDRWWRRWKADHPWFIESPSYKPLDTTRLSAKHK